MEELSAVTVEELARQVKEGVCRMGRRYLLVIRLVAWVGLGIVVLALASTAEVLSIFAVIG